MMLGLGMVGSGCTSASNIEEGASGGDPSGPTEMPATGGTGSGDPADDTGASESPAEAFQVSGIVVDEEGIPVEEATVLLCGPEPPSGGCLYDFTNAEGRFMIEFDIPGTFKFSVNVSESILQSGHSTVAFQIDLESGELMEFSDPLVFPKTGPRQPIGSEQQISVDDLLTLMVDPAAYSMPFGDPADPYVAGALLEDRIWRPHGLTSPVAGEEIFAVWAFTPYDAKSKDVPIGFEIKAESFGLAEGSELSAYRMDHALGQFIAFDADVTLSADGSTISSAAGTGLEHLTWLAIAVKS